MKTTFNKISFVIASFLILMSICGCSIADVSFTSSALESRTVDMEATERLLTFEEAIESSDCAAVAEYVACHDSGDYKEFEFTVDEVLYGNIPEQTIYLFSVNGTSVVEETDYVYRMGEDKYAEGQKYVLIMEKNDSLFYEHPRYLLSTDIFVPYGNEEEGAMYGEPIAELAKSPSGNQEDTSGKIRNIRKARRAGLVNLRQEESNAMEYTKSDQTEVIVSDADLILEVAIEELEIEGLLHNGNTYECSILQVIKGDSVKTTEDGKIMVTLLKDSVQVGQNYVVMVNKISEESVIYTQSSQKSVVSSEDMNAIDEIDVTLKTL